MTAEEKAELLEKEKAFYIKNESLLRALLARVPQLTEKEIEAHMQACEEYLDKYLDVYKDIHHPASPFAIKFEEKDAHGSRN